MTFAAITPLSDRRRLRRTHEVLGGAAVHGVVVHVLLPADRAHGVVLGGPGCVRGCRRRCAATATAGFIFQKGALDFAGGTVVHINAGIAGLVGCLHRRQAQGLRHGSNDAAQRAADHGRRRSTVGGLVRFQRRFESRSRTPSRLRSSSTRSSRRLLQCCAWTFGEWIFRGTPTMLGAASGAIAGLVAITPACGWVGPMGAIVIGLIAGLVCLFARHETEARARLRRFARCVRRPLRRRHPRRDPDGRVQQPSLGGTGASTTTSLPGRPGRVLDRRSAVDQKACWSRSCGRASSPSSPTRSSTSSSACACPRKTKPKVSIRLNTASGPTASKGVPLEGGDRSPGRRGGPDFQLKTGAYGARFLWSSRAYPPFPPKA